MIKKQNTNFIDSMFTTKNIVNKILPNNYTTSKQHKGASIPLQKQWKGFTLPQRTVYKILKKDTDRDGVPDKWDCQPRNPHRQDTYVTGEEKRKLIDRKFKEFQAKYPNLNPDNPNDREKLLQLMEQQQKEYQQAGYGDYWLYPEMLDKDYWLKSMKKYNYRL